MVKLGKLLVASAATAALVGCFPRTGEPPGPVSPAEVERARTKWPESTEASLNEGRGMFIANCKKCHGLPDRNAITADKWPATVERMGAKIDLSANQRQLILRFIEATGQEPAAPKAATAAQ